MPMQRFKNRRGEDIDLNAEELEQLEARLRGALVQPHDDGYDEAGTVYNAMHDRRPALIVQATGVADVMAAVNFARTHDLLLSVRGGGHSVPGFGTCDDGLVVDLGSMKGIRTQSRACCRQVTRPTGPAIGLRTTPACTRGSFTAIGCRRKAGRSKKDCTRSGSIPWGPLSRQSRRGGPSTAENDLGRAGALQEVRHESKD